MRYLVERSAPVDLPCLGTQGPRPIHWACRKGHTTVVQVLLQVKYVMISYAVCILDYQLSTRGDFVFPLPCTDSPHFTHT